MGRRMMGRRMMRNARGNSQNIAFSPFQQNGGRKRAKKSKCQVIYSYKLFLSFHVHFINSIFVTILDLFGIRAAMINTDYINEEHIEAAMVYIQTLARSEQLCTKMVVHMTGIAGETCTPHMLEAVISKKWLHGVVSISINLLSFPCHLYKFSNRHIAIMLFSGHQQLLQPYADP